MGVLEFDIDRLRLHTTLQVQSELWAATRYSAAALRFRIVWKTAKFPHERHLRDTILASGRDVRYNAAARNSQHGKHAAHTLTRREAAGSPECRAQNQKSQAPQQNTTDNEHHQHKPDVITI